MVDESRRDFIRKSAAAGGLVWAAPAIASVSTASAQQSVSPCLCSGRSRAIWAEGSLFGLSGVVDSGFVVASDPCVQSNISEGSLKATIGCPTFDPSNCTQTASVISVSAGSIKAEGVVATAMGPTSPGDCPNYTGSVSMASFSAGTVTGFSGAPNELITAQINLGPLGTVMSDLLFNEQFCDPETGEFVVRALRATAHVTFFGRQLDAELIVAEARVTSTCCPCGGGPGPE